jgi:hypothetical protein
MEGSNATFLYDCLLSAIVACSEIGLYMFRNNVDTFMGNFFTYVYKVDIQFYHNEFE